MAVPSSRLHVENVVEDREHLVHLVRLGIPITRHLQVDQGHSGAPIDLVRTVRANELEAPPLEEPTHILEPNRSRVVPHSVEHSFPLAHYDSGTACGTTQA